MSEERKYELEALKCVEMIRFEGDKPDMLVSMKYANVSHLMRSLDYTDEAKKAAMSYAKDDESVRLLDLFKDDDMVIGNIIVNESHMRTISKVIGPVIADVIEEGGGVKEKELPALVAEKLPDTDTDDINVCVTYACNIMRNNVPTLEELQARGFKQ